MQNSIDKKELKLIDRSMGIGSSRYSFTDKESAISFLKEYNQAVKANGSRLTGNSLYENVTKPKLIGLLGSRYVNTLPLGIQIDAAIYGALIWVSSEKQYFLNKKQGIRKSWEKQVLSEGEKNIVNLTSRLRVNNENTTIHMQDMITAYDAFYPDMVISHGIKMVDSIIAAIRYSEILGSFGYPNEVTWDLWGLEDESIKIAFSDIALAGTKGQIANKEDLLNLVFVYLK